MRIDLELKNYAISIGYDIDYHANDRMYKRFETPLWHIMFIKGKKHIWKTKDGWVCADLINGNFINHRKYYECLKIALDKERF